MNNETRINDVPTDAIVVRVILALLMTISVILNCVLAICALKNGLRTTSVISAFIAAMIIPDAIFYAKLISEFIVWDGSRPLDESVDYSSCSLWQFGSHLYPLLYSSLLISAVYHAFITLFLDYSGRYEERIRRAWPALLVFIFVLASFIAAPSAFFAVEGCDLKVPGLTSSSTLDETKTNFRLVYELVLPYLFPITLMAFPYVTLLIGLMKSLPAASHSDHETKLNVVLVLWIITTYLMFRLSSVMNDLFSTFDVWYVFRSSPKASDFKIYLRTLSYAATILWSGIRPLLCFKYDYRLRPYRAT